jgi:hypothetical protein
MNKKTKTTLATITAACAIVAPNASAKSNSTTCEFKLSGLAVYTTMFGPDNNELYCRTFGDSSQMKRLYYYPNVPARCLFMMKSQMVFLRVSSVNKTYGLLLCSFMAKAGSNWTRIY